MEGKVLRGGRYYAEWLMEFRRVVLRSRKKIQPVFRLECETDPSHLENENEVRLFPSPGECLSLQQSELLNTDRQDLSPAQT